MSKENKQKIRPVLSVQNITIEQVEQSELSKPSAGRYTLIALKNGMEYGVEFTVSARTFNKTYKNNPNFKVKKNPK